MTPPTSFTPNSQLNTPPTSSILARYRGAEISDLTPIQSRVDGWVEGGAEWLGRPENALMIAGGALVLNASRSTLLYSQARLFLAEGASALRPLVTRSALAGIPLLAAACNSESQESPDSGRDGGVS
jgi:hypothetical protein